MLNEVIRLLISREMLQNVLSEIFGIIITVVIIDRLLQHREQQKERSMWRLTRQRVGEIMGWAHTVLRDKLRTHQDNAYEIMFFWCQEVLERAKEVKQQFSFAFTAEMASSLEEYEAEIRQTGFSIQIYQWDNLNTINGINDRIVDFLGASDVLSNDIEHLYSWKESHIIEIKEHLQASSLERADFPKPELYIRL
jgi:hypothetical protein